MGGVGRLAGGQGDLHSMALGQIDDYVLRPAVSPDELFHHAISGLLLDWTEARSIAPHTVQRRGRHLGQAGRTS